MIVSPLVEVLKTLRPGASFAVHGSRIEWLDKNQTQPDAATVATALANYTPPVLTKRQKLDDMLSRSGLTITDLKAELAR